MQGERHHDAGRPHHAAEAAGERSLDWKPQVGRQVPIGLDETQKATVHVTSRLRE
jgi:hypothetical protein